MSQSLDWLLAFRLLKMLVTPFKDTPAFKLGIIDAKGKELKKMSQFKTAAERDSYTIVHRMMYRIKRVIEKVPTDNKKLVSMAAAIALVKEHMNDIREPDNLIELFEQKLSSEELLQEEIKFIEDYNTTKERLSFRKFMEEAPLSSTGGVAGVEAGSDTVVKKKPVITRRKELANVRPYSKVF